MMKPIFEKLSKENTTDVQLYFVNVDENRELAIKYGVRSIPAIKSFNGAKLTNSSVGVLDEVEIKKIVNLLV